LARCNQCRGRWTSASSISSGSRYRSQCRRSDHAAGPSYRYDSHTRLVLERKEDMRRRGVPSPDEWDAVALTFAEPVGPANFRRRIEYPPLGIA